MEATTSKCEINRDAVLALVLAEARMKLLIRQRSERLNVTSAPEASRRPSKAVPPSTSLSNRQRRIKSSTVAADGMPSAQLLNEIKLQRELDTLIDIYSMAVRTANESMVLDVGGGGEKAVDGCEKAFAPLCAAIRALRDDDERNDGGEESLARELHENQARLRQLKTQLETDRKSANERMAQQEERSAELRDQLRNIRQLNELEVSLVERWEVNRQTQAAIVGENVERALLREIIELKRRTEAEQRIQCELTSYRNKQLADLNAQFISWQRRYAEELAHWQAQLAAQAERRAALSKQRERYQETFDERIEFVREYRELEAEEQRLLAEQQFRVTSAVRIQAWWRGTMVRRGLGPYKKKSKKGKKGKAKAPTN